MYLAIAFAVVSIFWFSVEDTFAFMLFGLFFSKFIFFFVAISVVSLINIIIKYILDVKHKKKVVYKAPLILTAVITVMFSAIFYNFDIYAVGQGFLIIALLFFCYFIFCYRKDISISRCVHYMFLGLVFSVVISLILFFISPAKILVYEDFGFVLKSVKECLRFSDDVGYRWSFLSFHVNHLCVYVLFLLAYSVHSLVSGGKRTKVEIAYYYLIFIFATIVGILTLSKAFIVVFIFILIYGFACMISIYKKKALKIILPIFVSLIALCVIFSSKIIDIIERFFAFNTFSLLNTITSGRSGIWTGYVNAIIKSPLKMLFGFGFFSAENNPNGPHNFYLFILYRFGLVGIVLLVILAYFYIKCLDEKLKFNIKKILPLFVFLLIGVQEAVIDERFYFFIISLILLFDGEQKLPALTKIDKKIIESKVEKGDNYVKNKRDWKF